MRGVAQEAEARTPARRRPPFAGSARARRWCHVAAGACFAAAGVTWFATGPVWAATTLGPAKTAWYDRSGTQNVTGETTPAAAQPGELEVGYVPAQATAPQQTLPPAPGLPGAPVQPPSGSVGGNSVGYATAFAAVDYEVPLQSGDQSIDPSSITATLTLALDQASSANVSDGDLLACPTATTLWSAGGDQDASQAPQYSCADAVSGNVDSSAHTVTFALTSAQESSLSAGSFSLAIVPGTAPAGPFQAVFSAPSATSFTVTDASPAGDANANLDQTFPGADQSGSLDLSAGPGGLGLQAFTPEAAPVPTPAPAGTAPGTAGTPSGRTYEAAPASLHGGLGAGAQRTVALVVLLGLGTLLVLASSMSPGRAPRSLRAALLAGDSLRRHGSVRPR